MSSADQKFPYEARLRGKLYNIRSTARMYDDTTVELEKARAAGLALISKAGGRGTISLQMVEEFKRLVEAWK